LSRAVCVFQRRRKDISGEAKRDGVSELYSLIESVERHNRRDRPKGFLDHYQGLLRNIRENGRREKKATVQIRGNSASGQHLGTLGDRVLDKPGRAARPRALIRGPNTTP